MGKDAKPILSRIEIFNKIHFAVPAVTTLVLLILGICLIIYNPSNRTIWLAMILAPLGGLSRHFLGMFLNGWKRYPAGTFLANLFGSMILTILTVSRISISSSNETADVEWNPTLEITSTPGKRSTKVLLITFIVKTALADLVPSYFVETIAPDKMSE